MGPYQRPTLQDEDFGNITRPGENVIQDFGQEDKNVGSYILVILPFTRPPTPSSRSMRALRGGLSINALTQTEGDKKEEVIEIIGNYTGCYDIGAG